MGKLSCPPAVGRGGVRSYGGEREGRKAAGERDMKTWHALELAVQKQYTPPAFPNSPVPSCIFSVSTSPSLQIMLKAPCPSHDSLDVWSWGNNSPQEQRDNGLPASTPVHSSSRPCATWECPSTRLNLLWSVTGCSGSHWYASKTLPHTSLGEDKWWTSDLRVKCWNVLHDTCFSWMEYFPIWGNASRFSNSGLQLAQSTPLNRDAAACYWE